MSIPGGMLGLRHVALFVHDLEACTKFYTEVVGMRQAWQPDSDNIYLTSGSDNLALHRVSSGQAVNGPQRLDHIGLMLQTPEDVDVWHAHLISHHAKIAQAPKTHRDGSRSLYCFDPAGILVQFIYYPTVPSQD